MKTKYPEDQAQKARSKSPVRFGVTAPLRSQPRANSQILNWFCNCCLTAPLPSRTCCHFAAFEGDPVVQVICQIYTMFSRVPPFVILETLDARRVLHAV